MQENPPATSVVGTQGIVDVLLPDCTDRALDDLGAATFVDDGTEVPVTAVDQLLMTFTRRLVVDPMPGLTGVIQLPRAQHRSALLLAITSHLLCRQGGVGLRGPVILVAKDVDLAGQLRSLGVGRRFPMSLGAGNPLGAHRLTRSGELVPVVGSVVRSIDASLVYFNMRVGSPPPTCDAPLVILDGTTVTTPSARERALSWILELADVTIVAVGDLGDDGLIEAISTVGVVPSVLAVTDEIVNDLIYVRGTRPVSPSTLSSSPILETPLPRPQIHAVESELNQVIARAHGALANRPDGPLPVEIDRARNLLGNGTRLAAAVNDYERACAENTRPGEFPGVRFLQREPDLPPAWRPWRSAQYGQLATSVTELWRTLAEGNPKQHMIWSLLDELSTTTDGNIAVRCHSQAAARAMKATLASPQNDTQLDVHGRLEDRLVVTTFKKRFPAGTFDAQVLTGAPPPWLLSLLFSTEAKQTHVLCYDFERAVLARQAERWATSTTAWQRALARSLDARAPQSLTPPLVIERAGPAARAPVVPEVPGLTLGAVLDRAARTIDPPEEPTGAATGTTTTTGNGRAMRNCIPVLLDDGRTWYCVDEQGQTPVLVVSGGTNETKPVSSLRAGQRIVVPTGDATESLHARLLAAARQNSDVEELDLILSQFRSAARALLAQASTRQEAVEILRMAGAQSPGQLTKWADGSTIAPRDPLDVAAVFLAARRTCPNLDFLYAIANQLRRLGHVIGAFITAISRGASDETVSRLRDLVGPVADEVLDEFEVAVVAGIEAARPVPVAAAGRVR